MVGVGVGVGFVGVGVGVGGGVIKGWIDLVSVLVVFLFIGLLVVLSYIIN